MDKITKVMLWTIAIIFVVGMSAQVVVGLQPEYQTVSFPIEYKAVAERDIMHEQTFDFPSVSKYTFIEMELYGDWGNALVEPFVNGVSCSPTLWETPSDEGYRVRFDCTEAIGTSSNPTFSYKADKDVENVYGTLTANYLTRGEPTIQVHGTEYSPGASGKVWVQLLNETGDDVVNGACQVDIYTPTNDEWVENGGMTNLNHDGIYYYDFTVPQAQGVYPVIAKCYYDISETTESADGFTLTTGTINAGDYTDTWFLDGDEHKIEQDAGAIDFEYNFVSMCGTNISELFLTGLDIRTNTKWTDSVTNDNIIIHIYNYSSSSWIALDNSIDDPNDRVNVNNFLPTNNVTKYGYVDGSGNLRLKFNDTLPTAGTNKKIEFDFLEVACLQYSNPVWTEVKGSSEIHVTSDEYWVSEVTTGQVTNDTWTGEFIYNVTLSSQTSDTREDERIWVELPSPFPCHHVLNLTVDGATPTAGYELHNPENPDVAGCRVEWDQTLDEGTNYQVQVFSENWFKEEEQNWITQGQIQYDVLRVACQNYQISANLSDFTIPATSGLDYSQEDTLWRACQQYLDQYYHFNYSYFEEFQTPEGIFSAADMHYLDEQWRHLVDTKDNLNDLAISVATALDLTADYSITVLADPNNLTSTVWSQLYASISSSYLNYAQLTSITSGAVNVSVDTSPIASAVWNYAGTPATALLDFISGNVWTYVTRTLTEAPVNVTQIADAVWNSSNRSLTSFDFTVDANQNLTAQDVWEYNNRSLTEFNFEVNANETEIANAVWNSSDRQLTSFSFTVDANQNLTAEEIWTYVNRSLSEFNFDVTTEINTTAIAEEVWNSTTRELTGFSFTVDANQNLTAEEIWTYVNRSLSEFGFEVTATVNGTQISNDIWNASARYTHGIII